MFAIFEDGAHQYRVEPGDLVRVDLRSTSSRGDKLTFDRILLAASDAQTVVGQPQIQGAKVEVEVTNPVFKAEKIEGGKFKRRKGYIRHWGHVQKYTEVRITTIEVPGLPTGVAPAPAPKSEPAPAPAAT